MNIAGQQTFMHNPSMRPYVHRPRGLQIARSLVLLILVVFFPEVIEVGVAVCISLVYEMVCITTQAATVVTHVATVVARSWLVGLNTIDVTSSSAGNIYNMLQAFTCQKAVLSYAAVYGRSIESSYIQQVPPPGPASAGDDTICRTLACRVATFGWWLIGHADATSAMGFGVLAAAVIFFFGLWRLFQALQNLVTASERLVAQVERLQAKVAVPESTPEPSSTGPLAPLSDSRRQAARRRRHQMSKRSWRQTPLEEGISTPPRTGSDTSGITAHYRVSAETSGSNPISITSAPNSPAVESAATHVPDLDLPHQEEESGHATPIGPEDRAAATQDTAPDTPEDSSPAVSTEDQAAPPATSTDDTPTPAPPTQATEDDVGPNLHPFEDQAAQPTAAVAAASTPIAQAPVGAGAPGEDTAAGTPEESSPAASVEDQAAPPTLPTGEAAIINSTSHPTGSAFNFARIPTPTPTTSTQATEDNGGSNLNPSEDQAAPPTLPTNEAAIINTSIPTGSAFTFARIPTSTPTPSTHATEDVAGSSLNPSEDQAATLTGALGEDPGAPVIRPSGPAAVVEFLNGIQVLLTLAEGAINPAQGPLPTPITPASADQGAPRPVTAELAVRTVESFLLVVDVFQQDSKFVAAIALMDKVLVIAHSVALTPVEQAHLYNRRAMVHRAAGRPVAAFADLLHAAQVYPVCSATLEVMDQLVRWGDYLALVIFFQQVQDLETTSDEVFSDEMQRRMDVWLATNASIKEVLPKEPCPELRGEALLLHGEALLADMMDLVSSNPDNQVLMCLQARQQMQLGRFADTLQTVSGFLGGVGSWVVASRWALHVTVHVHWLTGDLEKMVGALQRLLTTHPSPLETGVNYVTPDNSVLSDLLSQLEHLQALWQDFDRLFAEDQLDAAEAVLHQVDTMSQTLMSPILRSRQLLLWAEVHKARVLWAVYMGQASQHLVVKALVSAERARALNPTCWRTAVQVWGPLLEMLGSGRALYDLWSSVLLEPDLTPSELVDYTERQSRAELNPFFLHEWGGLRRPSLNPCQLLGVTFASSDEEVLRAAKPLQLLCHSDKACLPGNSFVRELEGVGALMGKAALEAMERLQTACTTVSLVNQAAHTLGNRWLKAHAEAWMSCKYTADHLAGIMVPHQFSHVVWNGLLHGPLLVWAQGVLGTCALLMGTGEHQDLAPHELDVQQGSEAEADANGSQDVGMCSEDLPDYQSDDMYSSS